MNQQVNMAIQILPRAKNIHPYDIVDKAIEVIESSGLKYQVCPFETVVEGEYNVVLDLLGRIHEACYNAGADEIICNIKLQTSKLKQVTIDDKMHKYQ